MYKCALFWGQQGLLSVEPDLEAMPLFSAYFIKVIIKK